MEVFSPDVVLYLFKYTFWSSMEYCCHALSERSKMLPDILDRFQNCVCKAVDPSLSDSLKPLAHCRDVAILSLFYRYCFEKCSTELIELFSFLLFYSGSARHAG